MSLAASEVAWLQNLLKTMGLEQKRTPLLLCDNLSAVCMTANPRFHKRTKHFEVDWHYVRERVAMKKLEVKHIPASYQLADVFTKSLSQDVFCKLRFKLSVSLLFTLSLRGCIDSMGQEKEKNAVQVKQKPACVVLDEATVETLVLDGKQKATLRTGVTAKEISTFNRFGALTECVVTC